MRIFTVVLALICGACARPPVGQAEKPGQSCAGYYIACATDGHFYLMGRRLQYAAYPQCQVTVVQMTFGDALLAPGGGRTCSRIAN